MVVQHNLPAMNSHRQLGVNNAGTAKNLEKLSSGYRINRAGDDAAGLAISEKMRGQIRGLDMATTNAENGVSLIQTAEGGLNETHAILQRMRELAVQSANGTYADEVDRENINKEVTALKDEIDRIASSTHYNGINLLDGSLGGKRIGDIATADQQTTLNAAGFGSAFAVTTAIDSDTTNNGNAVGGQTASIIVNRGDDGTINSVALQVGDKTYMGEANDATYTSITSYAFKDDDGKTVATIVAANGSVTTGNQLDTTANTALTGSTVLTGFQLKAATSSAAASDAITATTQENVRLGTPQSELIFQIGANGGADQRVGLHVDNMSTGNLGTTSAVTLLDSNRVRSVDVSTREKANESIKVLDDAINQVSGTRADLGALQNRLEHTINNLGTTKENLQAAESSIRDVDMAKEMMEFTKNNILVQASQSMLAQSNQLPQGVLQLLR